MPRVAFVGALAASFAGRVRAHLAVPCDIVLTDEAEVVSWLPEVDVLVTLVFTAAMGAAAAGVARADREDGRHPRLRPHRSGRGAPLSASGGPTHTVTESHGEEMKKGPWMAIGILLVPTLVMGADVNTDSMTAVIKDTGSTNRRPFQITIRKSGEVTFASKGQRPLSERHRGTVPPDLAKQFFTDLEASMPLSRLPRENNCMKSVSFGSSTYITYRGETSPDIQCLPKKFKKLLNDYEAIRNSLAPSVKRENRIKSTHDESGR
jgi:hypothetical protein